MREVDTANHYLVGPVGSSSLNNLIKKCNFIDFRGIPVSPNLQTLPNGFKIGDIFNHSQLDPHITRLVDRTATGATPPRLLDRGPKGGRDLSFAVSSSGFHRGNPWV